MKRFSWEKIASFVFTLVALGGFLLTLHLQKIALPNRDDAKLRELQKLCAETPIYPTFFLSSTHESSRPKDAGVFMYYNSTAQFDDVREFYISALLVKGWREVSLQPTSRWLQNTGEKELTFIKGDLKIVVNFSGQRDQSWAYAVTFLWRFNPVSVSQ
jgi:hypothetical protein